MDGEAGHQLAGGPAGTPSSLGLLLGCGCWLPTAAEGLLTLVLLHFAGAAATCYCRCWLVACPAFHDVSSHASSAGLRGAGLLW